MQYLLSPHQPASDAPPLPSHPALTALPTTPSSLDRSTATVTKASPREHRRSREDMLGSLRHAIRMIEGGSDYVNALGEESSFNRR
eukprot:768805-Hanusia_phi.AAC.5